MSIERRYKEALEYFFLLSERVNRLMQVPKADRSFDWIVSYRDATKEKSRAARMVKKCRTEWVGSCAPSEHNW